MEPVKPDISSSVKPGTSTSRLTLVACDLCHTRKVRCDRKAPCGNCQDAGVECHRDREKPGRKAKEPSEKQSSPNVPQINDRLTSVEASVNQVLTCIKGWKSKVDRPGLLPKKRKIVEAFSSSISEHRFQDRSSGFTPPVVPPSSALKAEILIQHELSCVPFYFEDKRTALSSALSALRSNLNTVLPDVISDDKISRDDLTKYPIPDPCLIQWVLQTEECGRSVCSGNDFLPFVSRATIGRMAECVFESSHNECEPADIVCIAAYAAYFLQEIVLFKTDAQTGLASHLRNQAEHFFETAKQWAFLLAQDPSPNLPNLQALTFGVMLAQEAGDFSTGLYLSKATSKMCLALGLHKFNKTFASANAEIEAYYCFAICYMTDKGLAMNLGRPSYLPDEELEVNILVHPNHQSPIVDNFYLYLNLAVIQSLVLKDLKQAKDAESRKQVIESLISRMHDLWHLKIQSNLALEPSLSYASEMETTRVELAFFSVQTVIYQYSTEILRTPEYAQACLEAARAALFRVQKARLLSRFAQYDSRYMKSSFAHWTILYYPFTPFFVLFCNVIRSCNQTDYAAVQDFVEYLFELRDISECIAQLYKVSSLFISLIKTVMISEGNDAVVNPYPSFDTQVQSSSIGIIGTREQQNTRDSLISHNPGPTKPIFPSAPDATESQMFQEIDMGPRYLSMNTPQNDLTPYFVDPLYDNYMDTQPALQWLSSDFDSSNNETWTGPGQYMTPP